MSTTKSQTFVRGAFFMAAAGIVSKILGVVYVVPLQNMIGNYGMGLYQLAYALYVVMLYIALAGFPLALSKAVAERTVVNDYDGAEQTFRVSVRLMGITGVVSFLLMYAGAPLFATIGGNQDATLAIRALSFAVLVVPVLAAFRGYLQGHQQMAPSGTSQVVEQLVRVGVILVGTYLVLQSGRGVSFGAATATFGGAVGALASLILVAYSVQKMRRRFRHRLTGRNTEDDRAVRRKLIRYAIPISLASLVLPIAQLVDYSTVINLLKWIGWTEYDATGAYGVLTNDGYRLIQLPVTLATAIGTSLLPAVSEAISARNDRLLRERIDISFRLMSLTLFPATAVLFLLAEPIDIMLFRHTDGVQVMRIVSFMGIFMSFEIITTYMLQGIGRMYLPVRNMLTGTACKLVINVALIPLLGIEGAAISAALAYVVSAWLNLRSVFSITGVRLNLGMMLTRPLAATVLTGLPLWGGYRLLHALLQGTIASERLLATVELAIVLPLSVLFYGILTLLIGSVSLTELLYIPKIGSRINRLLARFPWLVKEEKRRKRP
ncbi:putative polysaccharide biosynthesis protein [Effusibacillus pohliae]|uniref:putative polysaccharide biosynthesis protein n=1 Tax=Effusibacillus pohliae TaxID=232270 RepID=UPI00039F3C08|nr:polysaccharide biosynthesis protein [Effusibacillus pohliae]